MHDFALPGELAGKTSVDEPRSPRGPGLWLTVLGYLAAALLIGGYALFLAAHFQPAISEPDDNGYFAQGSLLATTGKTVESAIGRDAEYVGMHWLLTPSLVYISRYPPGLPVLIAVVYKVGGYKAAAAINPALAVLALVGLFLLLCRVAPILLALAALVVVALNPTYTHHALDGDSHMAVTFCLIWAIYFLLLWSKKGRLWQAAAAGLFLGFIPTVRYGDAVMGIGAAVFFLVNVLKFPKIWKHYLAAVIGAAIPVVPLLIRNQVDLGAFWRTGYSLTNEETGFSLAYLRAHAIEYLQQVQGTGIGLFFCLGLIGMVWMICIRRTRALGLMLLLATTSMLLLYMAYYWAPQMNSQMTMRFLLPTFPLYVIAGTWVLAEALRNAPWGARISVPLAVVAVQLLWGVNTMWVDAAQGTYQRQLLATVTDALQKHVPVGSVVLADSHTLQDLDFVRLWKPADMSLVGIGGRGMGGNNRGRPGRNGRNGALGGQTNNAPSPRQEEKEVVARAKYSGTSEQRVEKFDADLRKWSGGKKVYFVGTRQEMEQTFGEIADLGHDVVVIADHIPLPPEPNSPARQGVMGMPGGGPGAPGALIMQFNRRRVGGMFGSALAGESEFVIAEWNVPK